MELTAKKSTNWQFWIIILLCIPFYYLLGYETGRNNFAQFISLHSLLFLGYAYLIFSKKSMELSLASILIGAMLLRLSLLGMVPNLSDDFFRFIWDGRLWAAGINPFAYRPSELLESPIYEQLGLETLYSNAYGWDYYQGLNSKNYYSVYPSCNQLVFALGAVLFPKNILGHLIVIRACILLAEFGTIYYGYKILKQIKLPSYYILFYALNPSAIIELTGNLHFEAFMIFFLSITAFYLLKKQWTIASFAFAGAILSKLIPALLLLVFFRYQTVKKGLIFSLLTGLVVILGLYPFINDLALASNLKESLWLYFGSFEFNAGPYYLVKWFWMFFTNDPPKEQIALSLNLMVLGLCFYLFIKNKKISDTQLFVLLFLFMLIYQLAARTVNPWYVVNLLWLSVFTQYRFPILWTFLIGFSYWTYRDTTYTESNWIIALEYGLVLAMAVWEYGTRSKEQGVRTVDFFTDVQLPKEPDINK